MKNINVFILFVSVLFIFSCTILNKKEAESQADISMNVQLRSLDSEVLSTAEQCNNWFKLWSQQEALKIANKSALANEIGFDVRTKSEINKPRAYVLTESHYFCSRLKTIDSLKIATNKPTLAENCMQTFLNWENAMDDVFTAVIFEKNLLAEIGKYGDAQDIHRSEARQAAGLCRLLK